MFSFGRLLPAGALALIAGLFATEAGAQSPPEVTSLSVNADGSLVWDTVAGADFYNIYQAAGTGAGGIGNLACHTHALEATTLTTVTPGPGQIFAFVITGESVTGGEGTPGMDSGGGSRYLKGACGPLMQTHTMNRAGFGWNKWSLERMEALGGIQGYLDEQLNPAAISDADNTILQSRILQYTPPMDGVDLIARHVLYAVYGRRQLEHKVGMFWWNHFNTEWKKINGYFIEAYPDCATSSEPFCDEIFPYNSNLESTGTQLRDLETFKDLAFNGNFRQMLEAGTLSPAMLIYLDLHTSNAGVANENQPRELLELHSLADGGGYTQQDVEELSRLLTGWGLCEKAVADVGDPLAPCTADYWQQPGQWTAHFDISRHDCDPKTLFAGTPQETFFPGTSRCSRAADAAAAVDEFNLALDIIAAHPSTARFISTKLLQLLVSDEPAAAMIDQMVTVWNDASNPQGIGDLRALTREALMMATDLSVVGQKIKTPFEQAVSGLRALSGTTDGLSEILVYLNEAGHVPYFNEIPTGYDEIGGGWVHTGGLLSRQNFGVKLAFAAPSLAFGSDPAILLAESGISIGPDTVEEIVDFYSQILVGGFLTREERQTAIDYLSTDDLGRPDPENIDTRIRPLVGLLMGYPQFVEQ